LPTGGESLKKPKPINTDCTTRENSELLVFAVVCSV